jgi:glycerol-3-phosphate dehydrogenase (NAD(P)+)
MKAVVIGDGGWGTALASVLRKNGHEVRIWGPFEDYVSSLNGRNENPRFLPGVRLPEGLRWTARPEEAARDAELAVMAVPSSFYAEVAARFAPHLSAGTPVVSATKGLDGTTLRRMSEIAAEHFGGGPVTALSGPSFAEEVARELPTAIVAACTDHAVARRVQSAFGCDTFRIYSSDDLIGVELGGALKNVIALAAGACDGIGFGHNTKAALVTRGLAEIARLGIAMGAHPETFSGLSGIGDLMLTCTGGLSRNRAVGERIGRGERIGDILKGMVQVAEGVVNCAHACALAHKAGVEVPIAEAVRQVIGGKLDPRKAVRMLMTRDPRPEREQPGLGRRSRKETT